MAAAASNSERVAAETAAAAVVVWRVVGATAQREKRVIRVIDNRANDPRHAAETVELHSDWHRVDDDNLSGHHWMRRETELAAEMETDRDK